MNHPQKGFTLIEVLIVVTIVGAMVIIVLMGWGTYTPRKEEPKEEVRTSCYIDDIIYYYTEEECVNKKAEKAKYWADRLEKAKAVGCDPGRYGFCRTERTEKTYEWKTDNWQETESSKRCSQYLNSKVSDLPVSCLEYWKIKL